MRFIFTIALLFSSLSFYAQDLKFSVSKPVDISKSGYDRLVMMENGNTVLFHFENRKGIVVKVFDSTGKEIASHKELCKIIDINILERSSLEAVLSINNEAVLFIEQDIDNRQSLVRLRFNSITGKLISEDVLVKSESFNKPIHTGLVKTATDNHYYLMCMKEKKGFVEKEMYLNIYNDRHEVEKTVPVTVDQKGFDYATLNNISIDRKGGFIASVVLSKIVKYPTIDEQHLVVSYLPPGGDKFIYKRVQLPIVSEFDMRSTYNAFANTINVLMTLNFYDQVQNGQGITTTGLAEHLFMIMDESAALNFTKLTNEKVRDYVAKEIDTNQFFSASVMDMYTNPNGLTTLIMNGHTKHASTIGMKNVTGLRRNIAFTQLDDKGNELFGVAMPVSRLRTYDNYPAVLGTNSEVLMDNKTCFNTKHNFYVAFNEVEKNFNMKLSQQQDSIYNVEFTNAAYYKLNKKKEITKGYLLGQPVAGEYKNIYPGSTYFDERTNTQAVLYRHVQGEKHTMHVAWITVD